jgi:hypothetical protein
MNDACAIFEGILALVAMVLRKASALMVLGGLSISGRVDSFTFHSFVAVDLSGPFLLIGNEFPMDAFPSRVCLSWTEKNFQ